MGEIKSTLDLVMEKTKHLTLTEKEKTEQKYNEFRKSLKGLVQKFQDKLLNMERFNKELSILQKNYNISEKNSLLNEIFDRLDLDQDNTRLFELLNKICGLDVMKLESVFDNYQDTIRLKSQKKKDEIKENLAKKYFISGGAVVPNVDADGTWLAELQDIRNEFGLLLNQEKSGLKVET
ncbi:hypothetical protein [Desulfonema magnum]|uniref:Uncharacterized protein n=1 Tax=Desulfonema magnum TaxID=45655 RepID=A0A975GM01_9BACT|nr:hypothetical protein [Desulfonema magnum]QTA85333.1 Uncharacterized protein dnm_013380 [Desulfonema magnum]